MNRLQWMPEQLIREVEIKEDAILDLMAENTLKEAEAICPVDTGELRDSLRKEIDSANKESYVGSDLDYSIYVELGTRNMVAQPYLRPALDLTEQNSDMILQPVSE